MRSRVWSFLSLRSLITGLVTGNVETGVVSGYSGGGGRGGGGALALVGGVGVEIELG